MALEERQYAARGDEKGDYGHTMCTMPFIPSVGMYFFVKRIMDRLIEGDHIPYSPRQMTINYYEPNEGLRPHTDNPTVIKEWIVGFSLLSSCVIDFTSNTDPNKSFHYLLHPGSVMIQQGDARYNWQHGISPHTTHRLGHTIIKRSYRISLQFSDFVPSFWLHPETKKMMVGEFA
jgi:alkylated DNA repair dioxygenase AlkB